MSKINLVINNEIPLTTLGECKPGTVVQILPSYLENSNSISRENLQRLQQNFYKAIITRDTDSNNDYLHPIVFESSNNSIVVKERPILRTTKCVVINVESVTFNV